jgi:hypothetical protein
MFYEQEVPVAYAMVRLAWDRYNLGAHPLELFSLYWVAFNNIYIAASSREGLRPIVVLGAGGLPETRVVAGVRVARIRLTPEREQIACAVRAFSADLRRMLIGHPSTEFFATRTPIWRGQPIATDGAGQRLNGVLDVGRTLDAVNPVWAPIDRDALAAHAANPGDDPGHALASQLVNVLYAVRNNTFHGGKSPDDASDREVLGRALPLIQMIVASFLL